MRILFDACMPRQLRYYLKGHTVTTAREAGGTKFSDDKLLGSAAGVFDVIVTVDRNMPNQQDISQRPLALVV